MPTRLPKPYTQLIAPSAMTTLYIAFGVDTTTEITLPGSGKEKVIKRPNQALILPMQQQWGARVPATADCISVWFRPGMSTPFLNLSLEEFDDNWIELTDLWSYGASNQLADIESSSPRARVAAIESVLIDRLQKYHCQVDLLTQHAVGSILNYEGNVSLDSLATTLGISTRQLRRKFRFHVGMTPKQLGRIERFRSATEFAAWHYPRLSLSSIAQQFGYFDQSHFARDVIEFSGHTPKVLALSDQQHAQNHVGNRYYFDFVASSRHFK